MNARGRVIDLCMLIKCQSVAVTEECSLSNFHD